jgi:NADPH2:quinone reductase
LGIGCTGGIAETTDPERLPRGQKVVSLMGEMGRAFDGSYAEHALVPNGQIYSAASDLPWEKPATIPETGYTAYGSIQSLKAEDADHALVRGATSSVGIAAARLQALFDEIARTHADLGPAKVFPFSELRVAHTWLGSERSGGKAVIVL